MRSARFYRYFLGIRPHPRLYSAFHELAETARHPARFDRVHLTLCVIAERAARDPFMHGGWRGRSEGGPCMLSQ